MFLLLFLLEVLYLKHAQAAPYIPELKFTYYLENHWNFLGGLKETNMTSGAGFVEVDLPEQKFFPELGYTQLYLAIYSYHGKSPSDAVGDLQWTSNIEPGGGREFIKPLEAYIKQDLIKEHLRFRLGLIDLSIDYNVNEPALLFVHSSAGTTADWGASGLNGAPMYPSPSFGFDFQYENDQGYYSLLAVTDSYAGNKTHPRQAQRNPVITANNNFHVIEFGKMSDNTKTGIGYWGYSNESEEILAEDSLETPSRSHQSGIYFMHDWTVKNKYHPIIRLGHTLNKESFAIVGNYVFGLVIDAPLKIENDNLGVMYSRAELSSTYVSAGGSRFKNFEDAYEFFYKHNFNSRLDLVGSYQFIENPSGNSQIDNAHIWVTRLILSI